MRHLLEGVSSIGSLGQSELKLELLNQVPGEKNGNTDLPLSPPGRCPPRCRRRYQARCCTAHPEKQIEHNSMK